MLGSILVNSCHTCTKKVPIIHLKLYNGLFIRKPTRGAARKQYTEEDSEETEEDDEMLLTKKPSKGATAKKNVSAVPTLTGCSLLDLKI